MPLDLTKLTAELADLQAAYADRDEKQTELNGATAAKADTAANGATVIANLMANHAAELTAKQAEVDAANAAADDALTAATVASRVADTLCQSEIEYVVALVKAEAGAVDPTPGAVPVVPQVA